MYPSRLLGLVGLGFRGLGFRGDLLRKKGYRDLSGICRAYRHIESS